MYEKVLLRNDCEAIEFAIEILFSIKDFVCEYDTWFIHDSSRLYKQDLSDLFLPGMRNFVSGLLILRIDCRYTATITFDDSES
jgi:hypothetical protein